MIAAATIPAAAARGVAAARRTPPAARGGRAHRSARHARAGAAPANADAATEGVAMRVYGEGVDVTDAMDSYANEKIGKALHPFEALLRDADIKLSVQNSRAGGKGKQEQKCEVTVHTKGRGIIRAEMRSDDMYASIDKVGDKIHRQARKLKDRVKGKLGGVQPHDTSVSAADVGAVNAGFEEDLDAPLAAMHEPELPPEVVRTKYVPLYPMSREMALEQLEALDHDFFVYLDEKSNKTQVLYRRSHGGVGALVPIYEDAQQ
eukprot:PRCOL_00006097-RA